MRSLLIDQVQIHLKAGDGGDGAVSFRREPHVAKGGPDGGDGGAGGNIWLVASSSLSTLLKFKDHPHNKAKNGGNGSSKRKSGALGRDLVITVPVGTVVKSLSGEVLCDLGREGYRWLGAKGGRPGKGNAYFLSASRRAPKFAGQGERGEEKWLNLELKLLADVALVGFPNAGKSTLISKLSAAKPKIADYPFTTLQPNLGVVKVPEDILDMKSDTAERHEAGVSDFVMADIPGLVEGAAKGKGLGQRFLRHIERASVLLLLLDLSCPGGRGVDEQRDILLKELRLYHPDLLKRPRLSVFSKADLVTVSSLQIAANERKLYISAVSGYGLDALLRSLSLLVKQARTAKKSNTFVLHRPVPAAMSVLTSPDGSFVLDGAEVERAVGLSNLDDPQAVELVLQKLKKLGVEKALSSAGVKDGDVVKAGKLTFTYVPDR
ncbi:MAG: GTPase ObgE [Actinobacteria bacterium]|nr:GTPase ObgE [Actinomycetota bacterium]